VAKPSGSTPKLFIRSITGSVNADEVLRFLKELKRHLRGKKILLFWDGLQAHRAKIVQEYLRTEKHWLRTVRFPAYAPELNPIEYCWGAMKKKHLSNLPPKFSVLCREIKTCRKKMNNQKLLQSFLKASELY
jgi:transposase